MGARSTSELAATKFAAPQPPVPLVDRPQLESSLCAALDDEGCRLILVSAPAGSGKSTVVASAVAQRADATAWLQLEVADGDPERFRRYLVSAIGSVRPGIARSLRPFLAVAPRAPDGFVERLVNALAAEDRPLALVLDDLHLVGDPEVHELLERLVDLAPPCFTLVAVTRADPPLRLGRLRLRRRLVEVRADALRFEAHQAVGLLGAGAARLSSAQLERLYERTEGWAAGLVLAGLSLDATDDVERFVGDFHGDDRLVVDYLSEEFLAALPPDDRDRLLRTSILERLHGPLVDAVCGSSDGATWLRRAAGANQLIIGLDRTGSSYRYHHLLGQLLRLEAAAHLGAELPELHRRAALWFQQHGDSHEAVEHLIAAGAHADAAELIWQEATRLLNGGQLRTVAGQIERLGPLADQHAGCVLVRAWISLVTGRSTSARRLVEQARSLGPPDDLVAPMLDALGVMIALAEGDAGAVGRGRGRAALEGVHLGHDPGDRQVMAGRIDEARPLLDDAAVGHR
ncbi:MAG: AAA family ATPase [Acidimicrobiales bacterium]